MNTMFWRNAFVIDKENSDEEHMYIDVMGKGTVMIDNTQDGISVEIFPFHVVDEPPAKIHVRMKDLI